LSVALDHVSFAYDGRTVIDDATFAVEQGLVHLVFGPTGCGKTTLALLLVGLLRPRKGTILVDGANPAEAGFNRQTIQLAFQFPEAQMFELTVEKELSYALKNFGVASTEVRERCEWAMDCVGLSGEFLGRDPHSLSFGERRKVALASAVAVRPAYLILDEPLAGLDWTGRRSLVEAIGRMKVEGVTAVILTHETDLIGEIGDVALSMGGGMVSEPRPAVDFIYGGGRDEGHQVPEFIKMLGLMKRNGFSVAGRPYRIEDVVRAVVDAVSR
jgi:energy-coupling factor transporter ATP-binding protein EcfA2